METTVSLRWTFGRGRSSRETPFMDNLMTPDILVNYVTRSLHPKRVITSGADEVWPDLYIGDMNTAENIGEIRRHRFTHVLNCAHNTERNNTFYDGMGITYMGIEAEDQPSFDMSTHFKTAAEFIHSALMQGGKVLVHCYAGVSRSATLVLAYLMLKHNMGLMTAIKTVKEKRGIYPNTGFLRQLIDLHIRLNGV